MATIKSYTDLEQSKVLATILPIESADMYWDYDVQKHEYYPMVMDEQFDDTCIRAWSLAALLGVLPLVDFIIPQLIGTPKTLYRCIYNDDLKSHAYDNLVDVCYEMILKLHESNLL